MNSAAGCTGTELLLHLDFACSFNVEGNVLVSIHLHDPITAFDDVSTKTSRSLPTSLSSQRRLVRRESPTRSDFRSRRVLAMLQAPVRPEFGLSPPSMESHDRFSGCSSHHHIVAQAGQDGHA
eukprot:766706-Hanusia_phi.AAC.4